MAAVADPAPLPSLPRVSRRGPRLWMIAVILLLVALAAFLSFPFDRASAEPWLIALQAQLRDGSGRSGPFVFVALLGAIVGLSEVTSTFPNYPREALRTRWAQILILVNALAAGLAFVVARLYAPEANPILIILAVGLGFQALIRTRFILAKSFGGTGEGEISLNLGWLYDQFQGLCRTQIDLDLMRARRTAVARLLERFATLAEMSEIAQYTIEARTTTTPDEERVRLEELNNLFLSNASDIVIRTRMALMILEAGGPAYVELLLSQPVIGAPGSVLSESLAKTLARLQQRFPSLEELVSVAQYAVQARPALTPDEEGVRLAQLERILKSPAPPDVVRAGLALMVLETGGRAFVDMLLMPQTTGEAEVARPPEAATPEAIVKRLVESCSLADLTALAARLTTSEAILNWVREASQPSSAVSEATQKAAIAHFLVDRLGADAVLKGMVV